MKSGKLISSNKNKLFALVLLGSSFAFSAEIPRFPQEGEAKDSRAIKICTPLIHKMNLYWVMRDVFLQKPAAEVHHTARQLTTVCRQHSVKPIYQNNVNSPVETEADRVKIQIK